MPSEFYCHNKWSQVSLPVKKFVVALHKIKYFRHKRKYEGKCGCCGIAQFADSLASHMGWQLPHVSIEIPSLFVDCFPSVASSIPLCASLPTEDPYFINQIRLNSSSQMNCFLEILCIYFLYIYIFLFGHCFSILCLYSERCIISCNI